MIIGIAGRKQCGKDTICKMIQYLSWMKTNPSVAGIEPTFKHFKYLDEGPYGITSNYEKHAWADSLKVCSSVIMSCNPSLFEREDFKNKVCDLQITNADGKLLTNREFLQKFGTEVGRAIDPDLWVKALMCKYDTCIETPHWIIPDTRFPNEANAILKREGLLIKVVRDTGLNDDHLSEHALDGYDKFDYIIDNNGSMEDLLTQVNQLIGSHI